MKWISINNAKPLVGQFSIGINYLNKDIGIYCWGFESDPVDAIRQYEMTHWLAIPSAPGESGEFLFATLEAEIET